MLRYYLQLSWINLKRTPALYGLVLLTLSIGIGLFIANLAIIHVMTGDPVPGKSDKLYHVSMNTWDNDQPWRQPMNMIRYSDANAILQSKIPLQVAVSYFAEGYPKVVDHSNTLRQQASIRVVSNDFFSMMGAPFAKGQGFSSPNAQEVVISHKLKQSLFGDSHCVGKTLDLSGKLYTIVGELKPWRVRPFFYHVEIGAYRNTEDLFIPLETALDNGIYVQGPSSNNDNWNTMADTREKNVFYLQVWVLLENMTQRQEMQNFMDNYSQDLKASGGHPNKVFNKLHSVEEWLYENNVVDQKILAFSVATTLFLVVCIFNASSLLLVRFNANHFEMSLRRALGVSRKQLLYQWNIEAITFGFLSALISLLMAWIFLNLSVQFFPDLKNMATLDVQVIAFGIILAVCITLMCSIYPLLVGSKRNISTELKG